MFEHPCQPDKYLLSDSLSRPAPPRSNTSTNWHSRKGGGQQAALSPGGTDIGGSGGSLALNRRVFLELYTTLALHQEMGLREALQVTKPAARLTLIQPTLTKAALQWLQTQDSASRFFLHPSSKASVELEIVSGVEVGHSLSTEEEKETCRAYAGGGG